MPDRHAWVADTYRRLADVLERSPASWDAPSLCQGWRVRHVVAHVTMPVRLTPERFGAEIAAAGGDFGVLSDTVAARDAALPTDELLEQLRSPELHAWEPPGGGAAGALSHSVIHSLDVTLALGEPTVAPDAAVRDVTDQLVASDGAWFGVDLTGPRPDEAATDAGERVALLSGRTLPDGRALPRR